VPVVELLSKVKWAGRNGTGAVIISPTRELALQIYGVVRDLCEEGSHPLTHGLVIGTPTSASHPRLSATKPWINGLSSGIPVSSGLTDFSNHASDYRWSEPSCRGGASGQGGQHPRLHPRPTARPPPGEASLFLHLVLP
jgi:hypothetical protein